MNRKGYQAQGQGLLSGHCGVARHTQEHKEAWTCELKGQRVVRVIEPSPPSLCTFSPFVVYRIISKVEETKQIHEYNSPHLVYRYKTKIDENEKNEKTNDIFSILTAKRNMSIISSICSPPSQCPSIQREEVQPEFGFALADLSGISIFLSALIHI